MAEPKFQVPQRHQDFVIWDDRKQLYLQTLRTNRFLQKLSQGVWDKAYPDTDGTVTYYSVTSSPALVSLVDSNLTPYQRDDQTWLLDLDLTLTVASGARTGITVTIDNVKFVNTTGLFQAVTGYAMDGSGAYVERCYAELNTGNIILLHASATTTIYSFRATGLTLEEQPSFAEDPGE